MPLCSHFPDDLEQSTETLLHLSTCVTAVRYSLKMITPFFEGAAIYLSMTAGPVLTCRTLLEDDGRMTDDFWMTSHKIESPKCFRALCRLTIQKTEFS